MLDAKLFALPVTSEFSEPGATFVVKLGSIAFGKPGFCFGTATVDAWLSRFASAV